MKRGLWTKDYGLWTFLLVVLSPWPIVHGQSTNSVYHLSYMERKDGLVRKLSARVRESEIFLDSLQGDFPKNLKTNPPWYLVGLPVFEEKISLEIEGLPPLPLERRFQLVEERSILGEHLLHYQTHLLLNAQKEIIPLNEEEAKIREILEPLGIEEVKLQGEGEIWFEPEKKWIVAEQFILSGSVLKNHKKEKWQIEYGRGLER